MFNQVYGLREDEVIRRVEPPFVEERMDYYRRERPSQAEKIPREPDAMMIMWHDGKLKNFGVFFGRQPDGGRGYQAHNLIQYLLKIFPQDLEGDARLADMTIAGDFVARADADSEQYRAALQKIISEAAGGAVMLRFAEVERPVVVFRGTWRAKNPERGPNDLRPQKIELYGAHLDDRDGGGGGSGSIDEFASYAGSWIDRTVIIEASGPPQRLSWHYNGHGDWTEESRRQAHDPKLVCAHIQEQTGLSWKEETRNMRRLFLEREK
jgi:hypothetical protein